MSTENPHVDLDWSEVRPELKRRHPPERHKQVRAEERLRAQELSEGKEPPLGPYDTRAAPMYPTGQHIPYSQLDADLKLDIDEGRAKYEQQRRNEAEENRRKRGAPRAGKRMSIAERLRGGR